MLTGFVNHETSNKDNVMGPGFGSATRAGVAIRCESSLSLVPTFVVVAVDATGMGSSYPCSPSIRAGSARRPSCSAQ